MIPIFLLMPCRRLALPAHTAPDPAEQHPPAPASSIAPEFPTLLALGQVSKDWGTRQVPGLLWSEGESPFLQASKEPPFPRSSKMDLAVSTSSDSQSSKRMEKKKPPNKKPNKKANPDNNHEKDRNKVSFQVSQALWTPQETLGACSPRFPSVSPQHVPDFLWPTKSRRTATFRPAAKHLSGTRAPIANSTSPRVILQALLWFTADNWSLTSAEKSTPPRLKLGRSFTHFSMQD